MKDNRIRLRGFAGSSNSINEGCGFAVVYGLGAACGDAARPWTTTWNPGGVRGGDPERENWDYWVNINNRAKFNILWLSSSASSLVERKNLSPLRTLGVIR